MLEPRTGAIGWWTLSTQRLRFPRLSLLAIEILSIPGMSDKPERVFSGSRRRIPWDRTITSTRTLEQTECAKHWADQESWRRPSCWTAGVDTLSLAALCRAR
jgi:hAT family C-terminal dimerisation region